MDCIWRLFLFCNFATLLLDPVQQRRHPKLSQLHLSFKLPHPTLHTAHTIRLPCYVFLSLIQNQNGQSTNYTQLNFKHKSLLLITELHTVNATYWTIHSEHKSYTANTENTKKWALQPVIVLMWRHSAHYALYNTLYNTEKNILTSKREDQNAKREYVTCILAEGHQRLWARRAWTYLKKSLNVSNITYFYPNTNNPEENRENLIFMNLKD